MYFTTSVIVAVYIDWLTQGWHLRFGNCHGMVRINYFHPGTITRLRDERFSTRTASNTHTQKNERTKWKLRSPFNPRLHYGRFSLAPRSLSSTNVQNLAIVQRVPNPSQFALKEMLSHSFLPVPHRNTRVRRWRRNGSLMFYFQQRMPLESRRVNVATSWHYDNTNLRLSACYPSLNHCL